METRVHKLTSIRTATPTNRGVKVLKKGQKQRKQEDVTFTMFLDDRDVTQETIKLSRFHLRGWLETNGFRYASMGAWKMVQSDTNREVWEAELVPMQDN